MKSSKYFYSLIMMALFSLSPLSVHSAASKETARPESAQSHDHGTWQEKRFVAKMGGDGIQQVEMIGGEYFFDPNYIVVKVNKPVELKIKKTAGYIRHNLIVKAPEAGIDIAIELKEEEQTVKFTPTKIGKYPIYSDKSMFGFKTDREKGMEGLLVVVK
jgi:hypothetical protein